jgi:hypothetical protein
MGEIDRVQNATMPEYAGLPGMLFTNESFFILPAMQAVKLPTDAFTGRKGDRA